MVLQHARPHPRSSRPHPNPARIAGIAGAVALNLALLLALLMPMRTPPPAVIEDVPFRWVLPAERTPPPPRPPERVEIVKPQQRPTPATTRPPPVAPVQEQVIVDHGSLPADPVTQPAIETPVADIAGDTAPLPGMRLEYADAPAPRYPRDALLAGIEGTVLLQVLVDTDGRPLEVSIHRGSGHRQLDLAARQHVLRRWAFRPAMKDGRPVQAIGLVPIEFSLGDR